ncbi:MAG: acyl-CoA dehydrogenase family protein [Acidimicrobiales bacterium]
MHDPIDIARSFARDVVAPNAATWELERALPRQAVRDACEAGLGGLLVPTGLGGAGLGTAAVADVLATLAAADLAFTFVLVVHNNLAGSIARRGTERQRELLGPMIAGERLGAFLLTEPQGGSDAANIGTTARRDGDGWVLDGAKAWITAATHADVLATYAQTEPGSGARGIAAFLVDAATEGVDRTEPYAMLGGHAMGAGGFTFDGAAVDGDALYVPPGEGFRAAMEGIDAARAIVAAMCCAMLQTALDAAVAHTSGRAAFGRTIADFQGVQWTLADVATDLAAARHLARDAAEAVELRRGDAPVAAAHAKKFATRVAMVGITACMQVMGADGLRHDHPLARHLAGVKIAQYLDGATEIQNVVIARHLFGRRP